MEPFDLAFYDLDVVRRVVPSELWAELVAWDRLTIIERTQLLTALLSVPSTRAA